jgi:hypothetical protein
MSRKRWGAAVAIAAAVLATTAVAIAQVRGPSFDQVQATITWTQGTVRFRECEGPDGLVFDVRGVVQGRVTGDPRLSGNAIARISISSSEVVSGEAIARGTTRIRDPQTNRLKVQAQWIEAGVGDIQQGVLVGWVRDGGSLYANSRTTFFANGAFTTQIGGEAADGQLPAVVKRGACTNPFGPAQTIPVPPPPAGGAAARAAISERPGWLGFTAR